MTQQDVNYRAARLQKKKLRAERRAKVARLYLTGTRSQHRLAEVCKVSVATIKKDLAELEKIWQQEASTTISQEKYLSLLRLQTLEAEAMEAWEKSKEDEQQVEVSTVTGQNGSVQRRTSKSKKRHGDASILRQLLEISKERRTLMGITEERSRNAPGVHALIAGIDTTYHNMTDDDLRQMVEEQRILDAAARQRKGLLTEVAEVDTEESLSQELDGEDDGEDA